MIQVFVLLVVMQLKHFFADYPLQTQYMLGKFKPGWDFIWPLTAHASVHAGLTFLIAGATIGGNDFFLPAGLALLDFVVHFTMDRLKAGPRYLGRFKPLSPSAHALRMQCALGGYEQDRREARRALRGNTYFWWSLGLDQMVHHLTHYVIIYILVIR